MGWNNNTNKFVCPYTGYYQFVVTLHKGDYPGNRFQFNHRADLVVGSKRTVRLTNVHDSDSDLALYSSTISAIVPCTIGQEVYLKIWPPSTTSTVRLESDSKHFSQFSGHLLKLGLD